MMIMKFLQTRERNKWMRTKVLSHHTVVYRSFHYLIHLFSLNGNLIQEAHVYTINTGLCKNGVLHSGISFFNTLHQSTLKKKFKKLQVNLLLQEHWYYSVNSYLENKLCTAVCFTLFNSKYCQFLYNPYLLHVQFLYGKISICILLYIKF